MTAQVCVDVMCMCGGVCACMWVCGCVCVRVCVHLCVGVPAWTGELSKLRVLEGVGLITFVATHKEYNNGQELYQAHTRKQHLCGQPTSS